MNVNKSSWHYRLFIRMRSFGGNDAHRDPYRYLPKTRCGYLTAVGLDLFVICLMSYIATAMVIFAYQAVTMGPVLFTDENFSLTAVFGLMGWLISAIAAVVYFFAVVPAKFKRWCDADKQVRYINDL